MHEGNACYKGCKGAHNGHKSGQHNGLAAVPFIKIVSFDQVVFFNEPVLAGEYGWPHMPPDKIIHGITQNACRQQYAHHFAIAQKPGPRYHAGGKQQGIARQKGGHYKARFAKNNDEQYGVKPQPVLIGKLKQMHVYVQNKTDKTAQ